MHRQSLSLSLTLSLSNTLSLSHTHSHTHTQSHTHTHTHLHAHSFEASGARPRAAHAAYLRAVLEGSLGDVAAREAAAREFLELDRGL